MKPMVPMVRFSSISGPEDRSSRHPGLYASGSGRVKGMNRIQKSPVCFNGAFPVFGTDRPFQWPKLLLGANGKL